MVRIGYAISSEEFGPKELVRLAVRAEETGFESQSSATTTCPGSKPRDSRRSPGNLASTRSLRGGSTPYVTFVARFAGIPAMRESVPARPSGCRSTPKTQRALRAARP